MTFTPTVYPAYGQTWGSQAAYSAYGSGAYAPAGLAYSYGAGWPGAAAYGSYYPLMDSFGRSMAAAHPIRLPLPSPAPVTYALPGESLPVAPARSSQHVLPSAVATSASSSVKAKPEFNLWEDTPLRYLGYANELGESWEHVVAQQVSPKIGHQMNKLSWWVASGYAVVDALHQGVRSWRREADQPTSRRVATALADAGGVGLFQLGASVFIPAWTVRAVREGTQGLISKIPALARALPAGGLGRVLLPALASSAIIPFIVHPIDYGVQAIINGFYWPAVRKLLGVYNPKPLHESKLQKQIKD